MTLQPPTHERLHPHVDVTQSKPTPGKPVCGYVAPLLYTWLSVCWSYFISHIVSMSTSVSLPQHLLDAGAVRRQKRKLLMYAEEKEERGGGLGGLSPSYGSRVVHQDHPGGCAWQDVDPQGSPKTRHMGQRADSQV